MNVIQLENLWKQYRLGVIGHGTLTHDLQSWWAKVRGKEDPNAKIAFMSARQGKQIQGDQFWALQDINLEIKEGEILGIVGRNGAGKSTLLKILSRVTAPTIGQVKIKGRIASLLEVGTGFHPELTGRENIFMNGAILGMSKQETKKKLDEIIAFSGVEDFVDTPVKRYSSGMYVRLAFAVAAHLEPEILLVDEVLAVGDMEFQKKCLGKMSEVSTSGRTVLFVSHNMAAINALCTRCLLLNKGTAEATGSAAEIVELYRSGQQSNDGIAIIPESNAAARHVELALLNAAGRPSTTFDCNQEIHVRMNFVIEKTMERLEVFFFVYDRHGHILFLSTSVTDREGLRTFLVGTYSASIIIPPLFFAPGEYSIAVGIQQQNLVCHQYEKNVLHFQVSPAGLPDYRMAHYAQLGSVLVDFQWKISLKK